MIFVGMLDNLFQWPEEVLQQQSSRFVLVDCFSVLNAYKMR